MRTISGSYCEVYKQWIDYGLVKIHKPACSTTGCAGGYGLTKCPALIHRFVTEP